MLDQTLPSFGRPPMEQSRLMDHCWEEDSGLLCFEPNLCVSRVRYSSPIPLHQGSSITSISSGTFVNIFNTNNLAKIGHYPMDSIQGHQKEVIIVCLTKTNKASSDFARDDLRLNGNIIIGDLPAGRRV
ncbi:unnamed protein product [Caenorhabditis bovis]|uniref:Uncharacterized protein n=1 Tax=Caenorhabditis bovis TaxID=2654633 RepID=A0A8S1F6C0_9PELO|nr:unnamed protein product [Caenorhabditis bovis]